MSPGLRKVNYSELLAANRKHQRKSQKKPGIHFKSNATFKGKKIGSLKKKGRKLPIETYATVSLSAGHPGANVLNFVMSHDLWLTSCSATFL